MDWHSALLPLIGVSVGWMLNEASWWMRSKRDWYRRLKELRIESYAEWAAGMDERLRSLAIQSGAGESGLKVELSEKRLLLIEHDRRARELIRAVHQSIPKLFSKDYEDLRAYANTDPEWDWEPYRRKLDELLDHVRNQIA